ncbi:hypothetical protein [Rossellomorea aquimaris]|uniref:hypothetical protein n=1 Tax=Rossellomorea aquimaris TaxID=189382 RepID=UPI001CFC9DEB|nr:hypothetical protein [Rossellomorea aquimaris]
MEAEKQRSNTFVYFFIIAAIVLSVIFPLINTSDSGSKGYVKTVEATASDQSGEYTVDWKSDYNGYKSEITKLEVADNGEITVYFVFNNDSGETYSNNVDLDAVLNRQQIKGSIWFSDHPKGEQLDGTTNEGSVMFRGGKHLKDSGNELRVMFEVGPEKDYDKKEYEVTLKF